QAEDGIRDWSVTGVQTCALPIYAEDVLQEAFIRWMGTDRSGCVKPKRSCAARSRASVWISSSQRGASARPMSARGFLIPSSKRRSEERRVGKESRSVGGTELEKK